METQNIDRLFLELSQFTQATTKKELELMAQIEPDTRAIKALELIQQYGGTDGDHHKAWVLDQVAQVLNGTEEKYREWVRECMAGEHGPATYGYDIGIAP